MRRICSALIACQLFFLSDISAGHVHDLHPSTVHDGIYQRVSMETGETSLTFPMPNPQVSWDMAYDETVINASNLVVTSKFAQTRSFISTAAVTKSISGSGELKWTSNLLITGAEAKLGFTGSLSGTDTTTRSETMSVDLTLSLPACSKIRVWKKVQVKSLNASFDAWDHKITCQSSSNSDKFYTYCNREVLYLSGRSFELGQTTIDPVESLPSIF